jgi:hypothetical protein
LTAGPADLDDLMKKSRFVWLYNFQLWTIEALRGDCRLPDRSQYFDAEQRPGVAAVMVVRTVVVKVRLGAEATDGEHDCLRVQPIHTYTQERKQAMI